MTDMATKDRSVMQERALAAVLPVLGRLRAAVETENRDLGSRRAIDYPSHSQRKNQGLLELTRLSAALDSVRNDAAASAALADLSAKLEVNHRLLGTQLKAAKTIAGIVARAIREGQSDGTYSAHPWRDEGP